MIIALSIIGYIAVSYLINWLVSIIRPDIYQKFKDGPEAAPVIVLLLMWPFIVVVYLLFILNDLIKATMPK